MKLDKLQRTLISGRYQLHSVTTAPSSARVLAVCVAAMIEEADVLIVVEYYLIMVAHVIPNVLASAMLHACRFKVAVIAAMVFAFPASIYKAHRN